MQMGFFGTAAAVAAAFIVTASAEPAHATVFTSQSAPGYCIDINMSTKQADLWNCHGAFNQNFTFSGYGAVKVSNLCLSTQARAEGNALVLTTCANTPAQRWGYNSQNHQFNNEQGWCADVRGGSTARGTPIIAWKCSGATNQKWLQGRVVPIAQAPSLGVTQQQLQQLKSADQKINASGGNLVASGGGNLVASGGGNLVASGGGNLVASGGGNLVASGGGNLVVIGR
ncbi:MAG TPA: RICIN domain-containing protein [Alphaproteobacteria bacterium]|nr:RICIN domain-containing protein [Alphaproteobacteria bacterium]